MVRKFIFYSSLILVAIAVGAVIWTRSAQGLGVNTSSDAQAIRETILRARRIQLEAEYTFDTSQYSQVYINDPRGGELTDEALAQVRLIRQDPTLGKNQVGFLDSAKVAIESLKGSYNNWIEELRAREAAGMLNEGDRLILEGETYGWPTPEPAMKTAQAAPTPTRCAYPPTKVAYPEPGAEPLPTPLPCLPTPTPSPQTYVDVPYRGSNPATLPPEAFEVDINSIEIEGDVAKAIVRIGPVTTEYTLVKVDGQWYIAGAKLLKYTP